MDNRRIVSGPKKEPPRKRLEATVPDPVLTKTLAAKVRQDIAQEKAGGTEADATADGEARVVVVLGPDGVPQLADEVDSAPVTIRVNLDEPKADKH